MSIALLVDQKRAEGMLGASQAPGALGLDKHNPPLKVWRELRGLPVEDMRSDDVKESAEWGIALEPIVRGKYALAANAHVLVPVSSIAKDGWLRCTPDGLVSVLRIAGGAVTALIDQDEVEQTMADGMYAGHLQVKTCSQRAGWQWEIDGKPAVPPRYEVQVRTEMAVTRLPWCDVVCLIGGQKMVGPIRIHRDEKLEERLLTDLRAFWSLVERGVEPPVDASATWRAFASERMGNAAKVEIVADADMETALAAWRISRQHAKEWKEQAETVRNDILLRLSAAGGTKIKSSIGSVTAYKAGAGNDGRWKKYALSLGGNEGGAAAFAKPATTWALRAPSEWGGDED